MSKYTKILLGTTAAFLASMNVSMASDITDSKEDRKKMKLAKLAAASLATSEATKDPISDDEIDQIINSNGNSVDLLFLEKDIEVLREKLKEIKLSKNEPAHTQEFTSLKERGNLISHSTLGKDFETLFAVGYGRSLISNALPFFSTDQFQKTGTLESLPVESTQDYIASKATTKLENDPTSFITSIKPLINNADKNAGRQELITFIGIQNEIDNAETLKKFLPEIDRIDTLLNTYSPVLINAAKDFFKSEAVKNDTALNTTYDSLHVITDEDSLLGLMPTLKNQFSEYKSDQEANNILNTFTNHFKNYQTIIDQLTEARKNDRDVFLVNKVYINGNNIDELKLVSTLNDDAKKEYAVGKIKDLSSDFKKRYQKSDDGIKVRIDAIFDEISADNEVFKNFSEIQDILNNVDTEKSIIDFIKKGKDVNLEKDYQEDLKVGVVLRELEAYKQEVENLKVAAQQQQKIFEDEKIELNIKVQNAKNDKKALDPYHFLFKSLVLTKEAQVQLEGLLGDLVEDNDINEEGGSYDFHTTYRKELLNILNTQFHNEIEAIRIKEENNPLKPKVEIPPLNPPVDLPKDESKTDLHDDTNPKLDPNLMIAENEFTLSQARFAEDYKFLGTDIINLLLKKTIGLNNTTIEEYKTSVISLGKLSDKLKEILALDFNNLEVVNQVVEFSKKEFSLDNSETETILNALKVNQDLIDKVLGKNQTLQPLNLDQIKNSYNLTKLGFTILNKDESSVKDALELISSDVNSDGTLKLTLGRVKFPLNKADSNTRYWPAKQEYTVTKN